MVCRSQTGTSISVRIYNLVIEPALLFVGYVVSTLQLAALFSNVL